VVLPLWTRTGRNRAVASARENFIVAERDRFLHSQRKTGQEGSWTYMCEHQLLIKLGEVVLTMRARVRGGAPQPSDDISADSATPRALFAVELFGLNTQGILVSKCVWCGISPDTRG
jgi:hypothetical protein